MIRCVFVLFLFMATASSAVAVEIRPNAMQLAKKLITKHETRDRKMPVLKPYHHKGEMIAGCKEGDCRVWTACYGNTMLYNWKGKYVRHIKQTDDFTVAICEKVFRNHMIEVVDNVDRIFKQNGFANWNAILMDREIAVVLDNVWWTGAYGRKIRRYLKAVADYGKFINSHGRNAITEKQVEPIFKAQEAVKTSKRFNFTPRINDLNEVFVGLKVL